MRNSSWAIIALFIVASVAVAQPLTGKLVNAETGEASAAVKLADGARFKVDGVTYRLEIELPKGEDLAAELDQNSVPVRMQDLPAEEAFTVLSHLCGASIVCGRDVDKDLPVSINTQDDPLMSVIEQVCFQIGAEATLKKGVIWITKAK